MSSRISYADSKLIPAPLIGITKSYQITGDGEKIGSLFSLTINGVVCADRGSPASDRTFWTLSGYPPDEIVPEDERLAAILRKQEAIRELFSTNGLSLEIQSADGSAPMKCNPRVLSIDFAQDLWFNRCDYTISLEADVVYINGTALGEDEFSEYISSAQETWSISSNEATLDTYDIPSTYSLTHSVSATGKRFFKEDASLEKEGWQQARDWVTGKLGFDSVIALSSGINNLPSFYNGYNHLRTEELDEKAGTYSVNESWVLASGNATEEFNVSINESIENPNKSVSINGTINGYQERDSNFNITEYAINNAEVKWSGVQDTIISRAQKYAHTTLNVIPLSTTVGKNPLTGSITYTYEYDDRASNTLTDSVSEVISMDDVNGIDIFGIVPVLGRSAGPVLQAINTKRENIRNLNIEIVFDNSVAGNGDIDSRFNVNHPRSRFPQSGEIENIVTTLTPNYNNQLFVSNKNERWDGSSRYSYSISWTYE